MTGINSLLAAIPFIENVKAQIITPLMWLLAAISVILFLYGVFGFMQKGDVKELEKSKKLLLWGLIGLFIVFTYTGIMGLVSGTLQSLSQ